jgi:uncharacterized protein YlxW (UPF0749 family)
MIKTNFCNLVIVSPVDPRILKIHISRRAVVILIIAFLLSFCVTVAVGYSVGPEKLSSSEHLRLQAENQSLQVQNKNAVIQNQKLQAEIENLEKLSYRVGTLIESR